MSFLPTHHEITQIWTNICPDFGPVNSVTSPFGVCSHGAGAISFVVVVGTLFGGEGETPDGALKDGRGLHGGGGDVFL